MGSVTIIVVLLDGIKLRVSRLIGLISKQRISQDEQIELAGVEDTDVQGLMSKISDTEPRYSFFRLMHELDGKEESSIIFIYTCPGGSKVKERMVYASFKKLVMDTASSEGGFEVAKRVRKITCVASGTVSNNEC